MRCGVKNFFFRTGLFIRGLMGCCPTCLNVLKRPDCLLNMTIALCATMIAFSSGSAFADDTVSRSMGKIIVTKRSPAGYSSRRLALTLPC